MPSGDRAGDEERALGRMEIMRLQLEANERLLLAALQSSEQADDAQVAQQRAEQQVNELRAGEQELRTTAEFRERLIGIIGHDLRTPLSTILMAGGLLNMSGNLTSASASLVAQIVRSAHRMERMISQLADFTRVRLGGGFALQVAPADLGEVCRDIADELRVTSKVTLELHTHGNLCGSWDTDRLTQALSNIVSNAVDHAAPETVVLIDVRAEGEQLMVRVTNRGPCIPPELLPFIFTAFRRAESHQRDRAGHLGLGLFVACEITKAHGGRLIAESAGGITTFTMRLPRVVVEAVAVV